MNGSGFRVSGAKLPVTLPAGHSVVLNVTFAPDAFKWFDHLVTFASNASNPRLVLRVAGGGVKRQALTAKPASLSFGQVGVRTRARLPVVLTNDSGSKQILTGFQIFGSEFSVSNAPRSVTLDAGQSITLDVTFDPQAPGLASGSLLIFGPYLNVPASGTGVEIGQLSVAPGSLNFGNVLLGATDTQIASLDATKGNVTVSSMASSNSQFAVSGLSFPLTISSGHAVEFRVAFTPQKAGSATGTLSFSSDATNARVSESLTGTGTAPEVRLSWVASTSDVAGYNIYRRLASASTYRKINSSLDPATSFTDATVVPGNTYYYVTTAVNSSGQESERSNQVEVSVP
jgi:hypothetical protein